MADYGVIVKNALGQVTFDPVTNAGRVLGGTVVTASGSVTVPGFSDGIAWASAQMLYMQEIRPVTLTISGNTLSWVLGTGVNGSSVVIRYGIR